VGFAKFLLMLGGVFFALILSSTYFKKTPFLFGKMPLDFAIKFRATHINIPIGTSVAICFIINGIIFFIHIIAQN